jgi:hypothetical protein
MAVFLLSCPAQGTAIPLLFQRRSEVPNDATIGVFGLVFTGIGLLITTIGVYVGWRHWKDKQVWSPLWLRVVLTGLAGYA